MLTLSTPNTEPSPVEISQDYLRDIVERLSFERVYGTPANDEARDIVIGEFRRIFGDCEVIGDYGNIIAGTHPNKARALIGAHFDGVPNCQAADDNASAVAVMLAVAEQLAKISSRRATEDIAFVAFNCEEFGISGSQDFVKHLDPKHRLEQVHILEMVGYCSHEPNSQENPLPHLIDPPTVGDFIGIVGNHPKITEQIMAKAGTISAPVVGLTVPHGIKLSDIERMSPHLLRSDHIGFWKAGISAVMWTDTAEFRNKNYHQPTDTPDTLDYEFMAEVAKLLVNIYAGGIP